METGSIFITHIEQTETAFAPVHGPPPRTAYAESGSLLRAVHVKGAKRKTMLSENLRTERAHLLAACASRHNSPHLAPTA